MVKLVSVQKPQLFGQCINVMFVCGKFDVCYSRIARGWMLESEERGHLRTLPNLVAALSELERVTGKPASEFHATENPYYGE